MTRATFVGREEAARLFAISLTQLSQAFLGGALDRQEGRNIVAYYGASGVGKSALLRELRRWMREDPAAIARWGMPAPACRRAIVADPIDFKDRWDVDRLLLHLRAAAVRVGVKTRAFDIGMVARWELAQPGAAALGESVPWIDGTVGNALTSGATTALNAIGVPLSDVLTSVLPNQIRAARRRRDKRNTVASCRVLLDVVDDLREQPTDLVATRLAELLDWDLRTSESRQGPIVAFADSHERFRGAFDVFHRLVLACPSVLWTIADRDRLDWNSRTPQRLDGSVAWPGLEPHGPEPRQCKVDALTDIQTKAALREWAEAHEAPQELLDAITAESGGWPIFIDTVLQRLDGVRLGDVNPDIATRPISEILSTLLDHLSQDERRVILAASLVSTFDERLAAAGAGTDVAAARRAVQRTLVEPSPGARYPFQIHDFIREQVRFFDAHFDGGWAEEDWEQAGRQMIRHVEELWPTELPSTRLDSLVTAFEVASAIDARSTWLLNRAIDTPNRDAAARALQQLQAPSVWVEGVVRLLQSWVDTHDEDERISRLLEVAADNSVPPDIQRAALRHAAYRHRTLNHHAEAEQIFRDLRLNGGADGKVYRYQHGLCLIYLGRFPEAKEIADSFDDSGSERARLLGEIRFHHGDLESSLLSTRRRLDQLQREGRFGNALELRAGMARRMALLGLQGAVAEADAVAAAAREEHARDYVRSALCSKAVALAGDEQQVEDLVRQARIEATGVMRYDSSVHEYLAMTFDAAVRGDRDKLAFLSKVMPTTGRPADARWRRPMRWWIEAGLGAQLTSFPETQWLETEQAAQDRWLAVVQQRREARR